MLSDGHHEVAAGKIVSIVTHLEMTSRPEPRPEVAAPPWSFERMQRPEPEDYLRVYRAVGDDWLWLGRLSLSHEALSEIIHLRGRDGGDGLVELDFREPGVCEVVSFGLSQPLIGGAAGRWMMNRAIERAWARPIRRFWLHTCTLDHPAALDFYRRSGFAPFRRQVEVSADPRLVGLAEPDDARHVAVLAPK
jgi:GNAT superfamily N-acetyltransferase